MDQQSADHEHQTEGVPGLCPQSPAVRQRVLVNVRKTRKPPGELDLRCLRRILGITWQDKVTNAAVLEQAGSFSMHLMLSQRRLRWVGHIHRMEDGRIPKDVLYGELAMGRHPVDRPALRYKDFRKRDLKLTNINTGSWESACRGS